MALMAERLLVRGESICRQFVISPLRLYFRSSLPIGLVYPALLGIKTVENDIVRSGVPPRGAVPARCMGPMAGETHHLGIRGIRAREIGVIALCVHFEHGIVAGIGRAELGDASHGVRLL